MPSCAMRIMMHLRLNVYNAHGDTLDDEGSLFVDLAGARQAAMIGIRSLLSAEVLDGEINLKGHLEIVDDDGRILDNIPFVDVLRIVGPGGREVNRLNLD